MTVETAPPPSPAAGSLTSTTEGQRLEAARTGVPWRRLGPYLAERQWGTVREDYSRDGDAWTYFSHDQARSRAYRWGEDGILGFSDDKQRLCFALAFWNGADPIIKERMFGLTNSEGNRGEDVKEYWFYLDATPTHSYQRALYKYPQRAFPYDDLVATNRSRSRTEPEYELLDTGVFDGGRYWDIEVEYAKADPDQVAIVITAHNRGPETAELHLLPHLWFRNTWSWSPDAVRPTLQAGSLPGGRRTIDATHPELGEWRLVTGRGVELLFTENDTNFQRLYGVPNASPWVKDGINDHVVNGAETVNPANCGTKAAAHLRVSVAPGSSATMRLTLTPHDDPLPTSDEAIDDLVAGRRAEADEFYAAITPPVATADEAMVLRQALAGMLWCKQYYAYDVDRWRRGDAADGTPTERRTSARNAGWTHLVSDDIISMPDSWEYPWFAAWDLAFHCVALAQVDVDFAKQQLELMTKTWFTHPNGQLPAYEWGFDDVNPPVHGLAAWRIAIIEQRQRGVIDHGFLRRILQKLALNFTWWVNRKDAAGRNVFQGGFLGLDNVGVFDRSAPLPMGGYLEQSDGTAWMAMYALNLLQISAELAIDEPDYAELSYKFYEHFLAIAAAMDRMGDNADELWDEADGFFYDLLHLPDGSAERLKVRSMVGLLPLGATFVIDAERYFGDEQDAGTLREFRERSAWLRRNRPELTHNITDLVEAGPSGRLMLSVLTETKLRRILARMLDEEEFLSPYGIRSLSRAHRDAPYVLDMDGQQFRVDYQPAESVTGLFGGNSNWRGPVWFPVNLVLIEALAKWYLYY
ncbi:MAG: glucosidase, partial [Acidimicrobiales bacterium]